MTRALNVVLGVVVLVLVAWLVAFAVRGSVAAPGSTPAEQRAHELTEIRQAARAEATAFLRIDYRRMDAVSDRVLAGATGEFKKQFKASVPGLKQGVTRLELVAKGNVREIGVGTFDRDSASVFVSAERKIRSKSSNGKTVSYPSRLRLDLTKVGDRWLVSNVEQVV